jgi:hypothetical protein
MKPLRCICITPKPPPTMKALLTYLSFSLATLLHGAPLILTSTDGRSIVATVKSADLETVVVTKPDGADYKIPMAQLDGASQQRVKASMGSISVTETRVRLRAQGNPAGKDTQSYWKTSWGSYDKDVSRTRILQAQVECTLGGGPAELVVQWIASRAGDASSQGVLKTERFPLQLQVGTDCREASAAIYDESDANYEALGERDRKGVKYVGWIARVVDKEGKILATQTSRQQLPATYPVDTLPAQIMQP